MLGAIDRWNGEMYAKYSSGQKELAEEVLQEYPFRGVEEVLDIGSGDGKITHRIAQKCFSAIGIDSSGSMIKKAKELESSKVKFFLNKGESFIFPNKFDLIVSFSAVHWIKDQKCLWKNIFNHLKAEGVVLVSLNPLPRDLNLQHAIEKAMKDYPSVFDGFNETSMPFMTLEEYEALIKEAGFSQVKCVQTEKVFKYPDKMAFMDNLKAWLPHVSYLSEELKWPFIEKVTEIFLQNSRQINKNPIDLNYNHFKVHARP